MRVLAYTYEADVHCIACTQKRFAPADRRYVVKNDGYGYTWRHKSYRGAPDTELTPLDENFVSLYASDNEGNKIHPVFSTDEHDFTHCGDCGAAL